MPTNTPSLVHPPRPPTSYEPVYVVLTLNFEPGDDRLPATLRSTKLEECFRDSGHAYQRSLHAVDRQPAKLSSVWAYHFDRQPILVSLAAGPAGWPVELHMAQDFATLPKLWQRVADAVGQHFTKGKSS